jgi:uncharacterized protein (DUF2252 family)
VGHAKTSHARPRRATKPGTVSFEALPSRAVLRQQGRSLRASCPRSSHAVWRPSRDRPDPVRIVEQANAGRLPELVPIRHARMLQSPFTFYRGTAMNMASDLAVTPTTGIRVQACGDAHLGNFRLFATPERRVIFDIHDLDETLPAPWEWDVKRLAASFVVASRHNQLTDVIGEEAAAACARSYCDQMAEFCAMNTVDVWYASFEAESLVESFRCPRHRKHLAKRLSKAKERSAFEHDFPKLAHLRGGHPAIREHPPTIFHWREHARHEFVPVVKKAFSSYRTSMPIERRVLVDRFEFKDIAVKVVGVGSVGTVCLVILLMGGEQDPLFLQVKEARASVLEPYAGRSVFPNHGQRVVVGHRLMQSASDIFLGWTTKLGRDYYIRQLRDAKIKFEIDRFDAPHMIQFAKSCGATLARAHARSGEPSAIAGYLGKGAAFEEALAQFALAYADQVERDYEAFVRAVRSGRLTAHEKE